MAEEIVKEEIGEQLNGSEGISLKAIREKKAGGAAKKNLKIDMAMADKKTPMAKKNKLNKTGVKKISKNKESIKPVRNENADVNKLAHKKESPKKKTINNNTKAEIKKVKVIDFVLKFHTKMGQSLFIIGNHEVFGNNDISKALPLQYLNESCWTLSIELDTQTIPPNGIIYNYLFKSENGTITFDWGSDKVITSDIVKPENILIVDSWNHPGYYENAFYTEPFKNVLLKNNFTPLQLAAPKIYTHTFKVKAPLLSKGQTICLRGNADKLGNWTEKKMLLLNRNENDDFFSVKIDLSRSSFPVVYKYGVYNIEENKFEAYEDGNNRVLYDTVAKDKKTIVNDGFVVMPADTWKGAGVAIPVFSLRSNNSCGVGEFADLFLLVDWAKKVGLKLIQILPVNDTTAKHSWSDSYPYAAISAFALHPMYLNLEKMVENANNELLAEIAKEKMKLNKAETLDYERVNNFKWKITRRIFPVQKDSLFASIPYKNYFEQNKHWLVPYAAFCYLRDKYQTADFTKWAAHKTYSAAETENFFDPSFENYDAVSIHLFIQYHLHIQLMEATQYAHHNGIIVKGDIPIGIYRNGADAWQHPELFHVNMQAGAPPDDFAITGQNWGFPTYNWEKMQENGFAWWKQRFEQMRDYFDAFRIDHILGFFRIWSIPMHAVEGIMGHFEPALPVHLNEFSERNIWFDHQRYCMPFINDAILRDTFSERQNEAKHTFLNDDGFGHYYLRPEFSTQQQVENYFAVKEENEHNIFLRQKLLNLISNVILFEAEGSQGKEFHFRFGIEETSSFQSLESGTQHQLRELYVNYFFHRQDAFWMQQAMQKLPALKRVTNMLVCGEDLGLVPGCVHEVMTQLGLLSLEIQRMPKDPKREFFHPDDAPYLSVVTPSTHDMSTIRGWWEEDRNKTQRFYNFELGQWGDAPHFCEAWVNKAIVTQHLYSPAMWSIFQLQDLLGIDKNIRRDNPHEERINIPANSKHYWKYRMHLSLEDLIKADAYNQELLANIKAAGR